MKNILFDMDWTLYSFENWKYKWSKLEKEVQLNALNFLQILEWNNYLQKFEEIKQIYWENFSIAFEDIYKINKQDYFNKIWDINPEWLIKDDRKVKEIFNYLKLIWYNIYIVSESPIIWINKVLVFLKVNLLISWIYSWEWNERKSNWLLYKRIKNELWDWINMVWDQIDIDIIKAKENWFETIYISQEWQVSIQADYNIKKLTEIYNLISN